MTTTETPERRTRRLQYLLEHPDATDADADSALDAQDRDEADKQARRDAARQRDLEATLCRCCKDARGYLTWIGTNPQEYAADDSRGFHEELCWNCAGDVAAAYRARHELVNGVHRPELAEQYLDRRG